MRALSASVAFVLAALASAVAHAECRLRAVDRADSAKIIVFFTKFEKEDTSGGRYRSCRIVTSGDAETFYVTPFRKGASVVVHESNWPKR
ncbi:MAG: hypothetical protein HYV07_15100 [Deltaproteobacteria bacterium]|nr:hypothetical protein [Deltaproteobacteria bacterium]